jgi:hypothetical protein
MPPVGFEPKILVSERPQTHALDRTATGIGYNGLYKYKPLHNCHTGPSIKLTTITQQ